MTLAAMKKLRKLREQNLLETTVLIHANPGVQMFKDQRADLIAEVEALDAKIAAAEPVPIYIGVDPAMERSGWAVRCPGGHIDCDAVFGVENIHRAIETLKKIAEPFPKTKVVLSIEYPTWKGKGTDAIRAAANCWIRAIRAAFPRRASVIKTTPQTWMAAMIPGWRAVDHPSDLYQKEAMRHLDEYDPFMLDDEAAAVCILVYAESGKAKTKKTRTVKVRAKLEVLD